MLMTEIFRMKSHIVSLMHQIYYTMLGIPDKQNIISFSMNYHVNVKQKHSQIVMRSQRSTSNYHAEGRGETGFRQGLSKNIK